MSVRVKGLWVWPERRGKAGRLEAAVEANLKELGYGE